MFREVSLPIIRSSLTVHLALVYIIRFVDNFRAGLALLESCLQTSMTFTIAQCTVNKLLLMGRGTVRNM
jgi:metal-sulfur cluster biosynthetic enzyme